MTQVEYKALKEKQTRLETIIAQLKFKAINNIDELDKKRLQRIIEVNELSYNLIRKEVRSAKVDLLTKETLRHFIIQEVDEAFLTSLQNAITDRHLRMLVDIGAKKQISKLPINNKNTLIASVNTEYKKTIIFKVNHFPTKKRKKFSSYFKKPKRIVDIMRKNKGKKDL
jgi:hypothetical protein